MVQRWKPVGEQNMLLQQSQTPLGLPFRWITAGQSDQAGFNLAGDLRSHRRSQACFPGDSFFHVPTTISVGLGDLDHGIGAHSSQFCHRRLSRYRFTAAQPTGVVLVKFQQDPGSTHLLGREGPGADSGGQPRTVSLAQGYRSGLCSRHHYPRLWRVIRGRNPPGSSSPNQGHKSRHSTSHR